jgi:hypothetical protein
MQEHLEQWKANAAHQIDDAASALLRFGLTECRTVGVQHSGQCAEDAGEGGWQSDLGTDLNLDLYVTVTFAMVPIVDVVVGPDQRVSEGEKQEKE